MSEVRTVQWFCDRCGAETPVKPCREYCVVSKRDYVGETVQRFRVTIDTVGYMRTQSDNAMLCDECKIEALEEVLKKLKARKAPTDNHK